DAPNYTPRISGLLSPDGSFKLSIVKSADGDPSCCCRYFYHYDAPLPGEGRFIHTYQGDGAPLPSFEGEPVRVTLDAPDPETLADQLWAALNPDNKVSLFVRYTALEGGDYRDAIRNKF
ncbi:MAG: inosine monophosphate cyclohydrolase, partial [Oscillibacter sp.]|nr:inosine monophosphate cyclohydrolase [Oscillibacter sp.]